VRFELLDMSGWFGIFSDVLSVLGVGVVLGLMAFGFFGKKVALIVGTVATVAVAPFGIGFLHNYATLSGSLVAYSVSTIVCVAITMCNRTREFDFDLIRERTGNFDVSDVVSEASADTREEGPAEAEPVASSSTVSREV